MIVEDTKVKWPYQNDESIQQTINSSISLDMHSQQTLNDLPQLNNVTFLTEVENITQNDAFIMERLHSHQTKTIDKSSNFWKLKFSLKEGLEWREASME